MHTIHVPLLFLPLIISLYIPQKPLVRVWNKIDLISDRKEV